MKKAKIYAMGTYKNDKGVEITRTSAASVGPPCNQCRKNPRNAGSSRCDECSQKFKAGNKAKGRLHEKIKNQIKNQENDTAN